ncbi:MAG: hypothetical protein AAF806_01360 [Bacteroidota bacterium]
MSSTASYIRIVIYAFFISLILIGIGAYLGYYYHGFGYEHFVNNKKDVRSALLQAYALSFSLPLIIMYFFSRPYKREETRIYNKRVYRHKIRLWGLLIGYLPSFVYVGLMVIYYTHKELFQDYTSREQDVLFMMILLLSVIVVILSVIGMNTEGKRHENYVWGIDERKAHLENAKAEMLEAAQKFELNELSIITKSDVEFRYKHLLGLQQIGGDQTFNDEKGLKEAHQSLLKKMENYNRCLYNYDNWKNKKFHLF